MLLWKQTASKPYKIKASAIANSVQPKLIRSWKSTMLDGAALVVPAVVAEIPL